MSMQVFTITVDIDEVALAEWAAESETNGGPYTTNFDEWDVSDLVQAMDVEIIEPGDCGLSYLGPTKESSS